MQDSPDSSPENPLFPVARALARSSIGRTFVALLTLAIFAGLVYFAFHHRDFTVQMVAFMLVWFGLQKTWDCLPFKATTRQRWTRKRELWAKHQKMLEGHLHVEKFRVYRNFEFRMSALENQFHRSAIIR